MMCGSVSGKRRKNWVVAGREISEKVKDIGTRLGHSSTSISFSQNHADWRV